MVGLGWTNWARLVIWLVIALVIYFGYSRHRSLLRGEAPIAAAGLPGRGA